MDAPEVIVALVFIGLVMFMVLGWMKSAFFPPIPLYGEGGTVNTMFDAVANDNVAAVEAGEVSGTAGPRNLATPVMPLVTAPTDEEHPPVAAPSEVELQLAPLSQGKGADEAA